MKTELKILKLFINDYTATVLSLIFHHTCNASGAFILLLSASSVLLEFPNAIKLVNL